MKCLGQSPDGYLWIGTLTGLARFDGIHFKTFDHVETPALVEDTVNSLAVDRKGNLWLGNSAGLIHWSNGVTKLWNRTNANLPGRRLMQLCARPEGGLWWRQGEAVGQFDQGQSKVYGEADGLLPDTVRYLVPGRDGALMVLGRAGMQRLSAGTNRFGPRLEWPFPNNNWRLLEDSSNRLWGGCDHGLFRYEHGRWAPVTESMGLSGRWVTHLFEQSDHRLWVATREAGLQMLEESNFQPLSPEAGIRHALNSWCEDREGNIWVGTDGGGLYRLRAKRIKVWSRKDGLPDELVRSVCPAGDGSVWLGTDRGLAWLRDGSIQTFPESEPAPGHRVSCVALDASGGLWVAKQGVGTYRFDGQSFTPVRYDNSSFLRFVKAFYLDRQGRFWIASRNGLICYAQGRFAQYPGLETIETEVTSLLCDQRGDLWVGIADQGLKHEAGGHWTTFAASNGLCDNRPIALHEDEQGAIWVGTESGLNRIKDGRVFRFRTEQGLMENVVNQILADDLGNLWLAGLRGIYEVVRARLDDVAEGRLGAVQPLAYGESDGLTSAETNGELHPCGGQTPNGHLWFASVGGLVEIDPRALAKRRPVPPVWITRIQAGEPITDNQHGAGVGSRAEWNVDAPAKGPLRLPPGSGRLITLQYTAPELSAAERTRFRYKLDPVEKDWQPAGDRRAAFYSNLRPGAYRFSVKACNPNALWAEPSTQLSFVVLPHLYERPVVRAGFVLAVLLLGVVAHRWRVRFVRRIEKLERQQALITERSRIAQDLHDDLGANLTGLALKADLARRRQHLPEQLDAHLAELADTSRALSDSMRESIWLADPRHDTLESLAIHLARQAESIAGSAELRCRLDLPSMLPELPIPGPARHQVCLAVKEALHNVVKHAAAAELRLHVELQLSTLIIRVSDDGRGMPAISQNAEGRGLNNIRQRLQRLRGTVEWTPGPAGGTEVEFRIPTGSFSSPLPL